eukprot:CAMPEP_0177779160 /NCGR_PEP_ID=MMETSP0491_2-20121128/16407_1 /TAXON_ID=63592 /ORGANISM="Tetraselmis chuii, Strain PLY429" /LENGTH=71 /DNA_ID=CAMNT_0019298617 /DNA_START=256 /DNA_END=471 /DNA_ORIENTATION=-
MRPEQQRGYAPLDDEGDTMSLSLDDGESLLLGGSEMGGLNQGDKIIDADFFNKFKDDFDESDMKPKTPPMA